MYPEALEQIAYVKNVHVSPCVNYLMKFIKVVCLRNLPNNSDPWMK